MGALFLDTGAVFDSWAGLSWNDVRFSVGVPLLIVPFREVKNYVERDCEDHADLGGNRLCKQIRNGSCEQHEMDAGVRDSASAAPAIAANRGR